MLKGKKQIDNYLNKWLSDNNFACTVDMGLDFSYLISTDKIIYSLIIAEKNIDGFIKLCKECREEIINVDIFILSFFHELGHYETQEIFTEAEWNSYDKLCKKLDLKENLTEKDYYKYWHHPIEYEATKWACDYIVENSEKIDEWWKNLQPLIMRFYKLNNIDIE